MTEQKQLVAMPRLEPAGTLASLLQLEQCPRAKTLQQIADICSGKLYRGIGDILVSPALWATNTLSRVFQFLLVPEHLALLRLCKRTRNVGTMPQSWHSEASDCVDLGPLGRLVGEDDNVELQASRRLSIFSQLKEDCGLFPHTVKIDLHWLAHKQKQTRFLGPWVQQLIIHRSAYGNDGFCGFTAAAEAVKQCSKLQVFGMDLTRTWAYHETGACCKDCKRPMSLAVSDVQPCESGFPLAAALADSTVRAIDCRWEDGLFESVLKLSASAMRSRPLFPQLKRVTVFAVKAADSMACAVGVADLSRRRFKHDTDDKEIAAADRGLDYVKFRCEGNITSDSVLIALVMGGQLITRELSIDCYYNTETERTTAAFITVPGLEKLTLSRCAVDLLPRFQQYTLRSLRYLVLRNPSALFIRQTASLLTPLSSMKELVALALDGCCPTAMFGALMSLDPAVHVNLTGLGLRFKARMGQSRTVFSKLPQAIPHFPLSRLAALPALKHLAVIGDVWAYENPKDCLAAFFDDKVDGKTRLTQLDLSDYEFVPWRHLSKMKGVEFATDLCI